MLREFIKTGLLFRKEVQASIGLESGRGKLVIFVEATARIFAKRQIMP